MKTFLAVVMAFIAATSFAAGLGDPAPALKVSKWLAGEPVDPSKHGDAVYLIFFFDPTLPNSSRIAAELDEIAKHTEGGKVVCIAIAEGDAEAAKNVVAGGKPASPVAVDDAGATLKAYAGEGEVLLPHAVLVGKDSTILWAGYPSDALLAALDQIVQGKYDLNVAKTTMYWRGVLNNAIAKQDVAAIMGALDEIIKLAPQNYDNYKAKVAVQRIKGDWTGIVKTRRTAGDALAGSADGLNELAWDLVIEQELAVRDPELAVKCAVESVRLSRRKEAASLDTLARAWYELGMVEKAIELQKEALAVAADAEERAQISGALAYYQAVLKAREKALTPAPK